MKRSVRLALWMLLLAPACADPQSAYDAFANRTAETRNVDAGTVVPSDRFDWSGRYLFALSATLSPDTPILFEVDATVATDLSSIELSFQPLAIDSDATPRAKVGDPVVIKGITYAEDGSFNADLGEVTVPGRANPISGSDIVATVMLVGSARAEQGTTPELFCGQVSGMVTMPLAFDLAGSTFGAQLITNLKTDKPLLRCPSAP